MIIDMLLARIFSVLEVLFAVGSYELFIRGYHWWSVIAFISGLLLCNSLRVKMD